MRATYFFLLVQVSKNILVYVNFIASIRDKLKEGVHVLMWNGRYIRPIRIKN
jgi:hypothetical protein